MPIFHELTLVLQWIREGQIPITRSLQRICNDAAIREDTKERMRESHIFDEGVPEWLVELFLTDGLTEAEIAHVGEWPADQKEALRAELSFVYDANRPINFSWEIAKDNIARMDVGTGADGVSSVVFFSPRNTLHASGTPSLT